MQEAQDWVVTTLVAFDRTQTAEIATTQSILQDAC